MPAFCDITGQRFGRLLVIGISKRRLTGKTMWSCKCDCGVRVVVRVASLRTGHSRSCGCLARELASSHGLSRTKEHVAWAAMKGRCQNPRNRAYADYGGRGIIVCDRWSESFENFLADMGPSPSLDHSIDREEVDGNYEPGNCRWATREEQGSNKRNTIYLTHKGRTLPLSAWSRETGLGSDTIRYRLSLGWSHHDALTLSPHECKRKKTK